jgi:cytoskeletal protein CcmA (bactofilin family)
MPVLIDKVGKLHESAVRHLRSLLREHPHRSSPNTNRRTEEHSKMAEQADDLGIPMKLRPASATKVPPPRVADAPRLGVDAAHAAGSPQQPTEGSAGSRGNEVDRRTLIVGEGISLSGEVTSCDRLIVEGAIEAKLQKCQYVIIAETGVFNGHASTENADVRGRFEGELVVRKRLLIRAGGHVSGSVSYGEIEIESGGKITGVIEEIAPGNLFSGVLPISA